MFYSDLIRTEILHIVQSLFLTKYLNNFQKKKSPLSVKVRKYQDLHLRHLQQVQPY